MNLHEVTDTIEPVLKQREKLDVKRPKSYMCILHNDDYTDGEALINLIMKHFRHDENQAMEIVLRAHQDGQSPCGGPYGKDEAETRAARAMQEAEQHEAIGGGPSPLLISVEEVATD